MHCGDGIVHDATVTANSRQISLPGTFSSQLFEIRYRQVLLGGASYSMNSNGRARAGVEHAMRPGSFAD
jgi:hypothetical protein